MARLTYGIVAAALTALVAGFFVKTSTLPLVLSIAFSAGATVLILIGWGRRLRLEQEGGVPHPELDEVEEIDFIELGVDVADPDAAYRPPARKLPRRDRPRRERLAADAKVDLPEDAELTFELPVVVEQLPPRRRKPAPKAKPKPAPARGTGTRQARVVVIPGRGRYHTHSCRFAARGGAVEMTVATARRRGYDACSVCSPDEVTPS